MLKRTGYDTAITAAILPAVFLPAHNRLTGVRSTLHCGDPQPPLGGCGSFVFGKEYLLWLLS